MILTQCIEDFAPARAAEAAPEGSVLRNGRRRGRRVEKATARGGFSLPEAEIFCSKSFPMPVFRAPKEEAKIEVAHEEKSAIFAGKSTSL